MRSPNDGLDFRPMDEFISHILQSIRDNGSAAVRIFPPPSGVLQLYSDRLAMEVVSEPFRDVPGASTDVRKLPGWGVHYTATLPCSRDLERGLPQSHRGLFCSIMEDGGCDPGGFSGE